MPLSRSPVSFRPTKRKLNSFKRPFYPAKLHGVATTTECSLRINFGILRTRRHPELLSNQHHLNHLKPLTRFPPQIHRQPRATPNELATTPLLHRFTFNLPQKTHRRLNTARLATKSNAPQASQSRHQRDALPSTRSTTPPFNHLKTVSTTAEVRLNEC